MAVVVPDPPASGKFSLESVDGRLRWVALDVLLEEELYEERTGSSTPAAGAYLVVDTVDVGSRRLTLGASRDVPDDEEAGVTVRVLAAESGAEERDLERVERVLGVAVQTVEDYAPRAPQVLKNEAVIRFGSYLLASDYGAFRSETLGPMSMEHVTNHAAAFRNCGAAAMLSRYRRRRARSG